MTTTAATAATLREFRARLEEVVAKGGDGDAALEVLRELEPLAGEVTLDDLRVQKIGVPVGKLRKHADPRVATLATAIVARWKTLVPPGQSPSISPPPQPSSSSQQQHQ
jgi:hypothetical protein